MTRSEDPTEAHQGAPTQDSVAQSHKLKGQSDSIKKAQNGQQHHRKPPTFNETHQGAPPTQSRMEDQRRAP